MLDNQGTCEACGAKRIPRPCWTTKGRARRAVRSGSSGRLARTTTCDPDRDGGSGGQKVEADERQRLGHFVPR